MTAAISERGRVFEGGGRSIGVNDRILVTGGAGFIGSHLVGALAGAGRSVVVLDVLTEAVHGPDAQPPEFGPGVTFLRGDVRDPGAWREALRGVEVVYHLAAETGTGESMYRSHRYVDVNVGGVARLCDAVAGQRGPAPRRVVLASSRAVYGEGPYRCAACGVVYPPGRDVERLRRGEWDPVCPFCGGDVAPLAAAESARAAPTSAYGVTKVGQESLLGLLLPPHGVEVVTLRLQNVYGPGQSLRNPYTGVLAIFAGLLLSGEEVRIFEDGRQTRDWVFVDDVVRALVRAAELEVEAPEVINVGSGRATPLVEVARRLAAALGVEERGGRIRVTGEYRIGDVRHAVADVSVQRERLGVEPAVELGEGLARFAAWVREAGLAGSRLRAALDEMRGAGLLRAVEAGS